MFLRIGGFVGGKEFWGGKRVIDGEGRWEVYLEIVGWDLFGWNRKFFGSSDRKLIRLEGGCRVVRWWGCWWVRRCFIGEFGFNWIYKFIFLEV